MGKMAVRGDLEFGRVAICTTGVELSKAVSSIWLRVHKGPKGNGFRGNAGENIKGVSGDGIGEVRDDGNAVPSVRSLI